MTDTYCVSAVPHQFLRVSYYYPIVQIRKLSPTPAQSETRTKPGSILLRHIIAALLPEEVSQVHQVTAGVGSRLPSVSLGNPPSVADTWNSPFQAFNVSA